jgi:DNA-binding transcriptional ArsR family regulator
MARLLVHLGVNATEPGGSFDAHRREMDDFRKIVTVARAIAVPSRLALLRVLGETGMPLTAAAATVGISPATAHHHLDVLTKAGLVSKTVSGRRAVYRWSRSRWQFVRARPPTPTMPPAATEEG